MKTKNMCKVIEKFLTTHEHFETIELAKEIESQLKADFIEQDYIHRGEKTTERDYYYYTNGAQAREAEIEALKAENAKLTEQLKNAVALPCNITELISLCVAGDKCIAKTIGKIYIKQLNSEIWFRMETEEDYAKRAKLEAQDDRD